MVLPGSTLMRGDVAERAGIEPARACGLDSLARSCRRRPSAGLSGMVARAGFEPAVFTTWVVGLQPTVFASRLTAPSWSGRWDLNPQNLRGLNAAPLPFDHCRELGPPSGIRTRTQQPLRLSPLPVGLSTVERLVPLVGFEPTRLPGFEPGASTCCATGAYSIVGGRGGDRTPKGG